MLKLTLLLKALYILPNVSGSLIWRNESIHDTSLNRTIKKPCNSSKKPHKKLWKKAIKERNQRKTCKRLIWNEAGSQQSKAMPPVWLRRGGELYKELVAMLLWGCIWACDLLCIITSGLQPLSRNCISLMLLPAHVHCSELGLTHSGTCKYIIGGLLFGQALSWLPLGSNNSPEHV